MLEDVDPQMEAEALRINYCNIVEVKNQECKAIYKLLLETFRDSVWLDMKHTQNLRQRPDSSKSLSHDDEDMLSSHLSLKNLDRDSQRRQRDRERLHQEYLVPRAIKSKIEKEFDDFNRGRINSSTFLSENGYQMPSPHSHSAKPRLSTADSWTPSLSKQLSEQNSQSKAAIKIKYSVKQPELMTVRRTDGGSILRVKKASPGLFQPTQTQDSKPNTVLSSSREGKLSSRAQDQPLSVIMGNRAYRRAPDLRVQANKTLDSIHEDSRSQEQMHSSRHASVSVDYRPNSREGEQSSRNRLPTKSSDHARLFSRTVDHDAAPSTQKYTRLPQVLGKQSGASQEDHSPETGMTAVKLPENNLVGPLNDLQETDIPAVPFFSLKIRKNNSGLSRSARSAVTTKVLELGESQGLLRSTKAFSVHHEATQTDDTVDGLLGAVNRESSKNRVQKYSSEKSTAEMSIQQGSRLHVGESSKASGALDVGTLRAAQVPHLDFSKRRGLGSSSSDEDSRWTQYLAANASNTWPLSDGSPALQRLVRLFADSVSCSKGEDPAVHLCSSPLMCFYVLEGMTLAPETEHETQHMLQTSGVCGVFRAGNSQLEVWKYSQDLPRPIIINLEPTGPIVSANSSETRILEVNLDQMLNANENTVYKTKQRTAQATTWLCWNAKALDRIRQLCEVDPEEEGHFLIWLSKWNLMLSHIE